MLKNRNSLLSRFTPLSQHPQKLQFIVHIFSLSQALNAKWITQLKRTGIKPAEKREKKPAVSKGWVSDTKVDKDIFLTRNKPGSAALSAQQNKRSTMGPHAAPKKQPQQQRGGRQARIPRGKENRRDFNYIGEDPFL